MIYVLMYLAAAVGANLAISYFGPSAALWVAFLLVGLDLTARDKLHEAWHGNGLVWKMGLLIAAGSLLSYAINRNAGMIAVASFAAFTLAALADTLTYQLLYKRGYMVKVNGSNVISAAVDSLVFPTIAFGGFLPWVTLGQFAAKVLGGFVWSWVLQRRQWVDDSEAHSGMW
jgi:queuosine precursor transporter